MKPSCLLLAFSMLITSPFMHAWVQYSPVKQPEIFPLLGQTVYVRIDDELTASVSSVSRALWTEDLESLLFPIICSDNEKAFDCLETAHPIVRADDLDITSFAPATVQGLQEPTIPKCKVYWFRAVLTDHQRTKLKHSGIDSLRLEYRQRLIDGRFYYLPTIAEAKEVKAAMDATLAYQMIVRSSKLVLRAPPKRQEYERLSDVLVIYLQHMKLVEIDAK